MGEGIKMANNKYGVLLLGGYRTHQENYALMFAADPRCQLIACSDELDAPADRVELNMQLADELNLPYITDLDQALALTDVNIVSLCVEMERRGIIGKKCAQAGKHLYLDKPLALTVTDAELIVQAVQSSGVTSQMFSNVYCPWAQLAKKAIESGEIGQLRAMHCDVVFAKGHPGTAPVGRKRQEQSSRDKYTFIQAKPEMFDIGVYAVSIINWLSNKAVKTVSGVTANYFFEEHSKCNIEDFGVLMMSMEDDITATITGGRMGWMSHPKGGIQRLYLVGTQKTMVFDPYQSRLQICADEAPFQPPAPHPRDPMGMWKHTQDEVELLPKQSWILTGDESWQNREFSAFIDAVEAGKEGEMHAALAAQSIAVITAGYQSAASGRTISID